MNFTDPFGYWSWSGIPNWLLARAIDIALLIYTGGIAVHSIKTIYALIRTHRNKITRVVESQIKKHVGSIAGTLASTALNIALSAIGRSIGDIIAIVIDNFIDPLLGFKKGNGRSFG